jgi:archaellum biogenesis protein FlaJ (TadC family)
MESEAQKLTPAQHLLKEFGSYKDLADKLGMSYQTAFSFSFRKIPHKHIDKLIQLSEGRLTKEMLRPDDTYAA